MSILKNGFMHVLHHNSYTSAKNSRIASSLAGFGGCSAVFAFAPPARAAAAADALLWDDMGRAPEPPPEEDGGCAVASGLCRSRKRTFVPVRKQETWLLWKRSTVLRYLCVVSSQPVCAVLENSRTHIAPELHCSSSTTSSAACTTKGFVWRASSRKRGVPSPPEREVPNSRVKSGLSFVPIMAK